jgi:cyclopropane fatty-acyl-phospholipid synthase-like methyltransferase
MSRNFSQAAENNKQPILKVVQQYLRVDDCLLEIGSGTGQHMAFFSEHLPEVTFQPSDIEIGGLEFLQDLGRSNLLPAQELEMSDNSTTLTQAFEVIYTANTTHIMSKSEVNYLIEFVAKHLKKGGYFLCYGPFKFKGCFTTPSNEAFDAFLKNKKVTMGLRDFETLQALADKNQLSFIKKYDMPANNHILVWQK